jgi:arginase family enzyme
MTPLNTLLCLAWLVCPGVPLGNQHGRPVRTKRQTTTHRVIIDKRGHTHTHRLITSNTQPKSRLTSVSFLGAGFHAGQPTDGVARGPAALLGAGLGRAVKDLGMSWSELELHFPTPDLFEFCPDAGLHKIKNAVEDAAASGNFVLTVGGDHSIAAASIAGMEKVHPDVAIVWVDAHADCNTPSTSTSGNYHGMPAAHLMGWFNETPPGFEW